MELHEPAGSKTGSNRPIAVRSSVEGVFLMVGVCAQQGQVLSTAALTSPQDANPHLHIDCVRSIIPIS